MLARKLIRANEAVIERVMDSNDLERERGITILAKMSNSPIWTDTLACSFLRPAGEWGMATHPPQGAMRAGSGEQAARKRGDAGCDSAAPNSFCYGVGAMAGLPSTADAASSAASALFVVVILICTYLLPPA